MSVSEGSACCSRRNRVWGKLLAFRVQQHPRHRAGANRQANIPQEGQQGGLTHVRTMPEGGNQRMNRGAEPAPIPRWQRCGEGGVCTRDIPDLTHGADNLHVDPQALHDYSIDFAYARR